MSCSVYAISKYAWEKGNFQPILQERKIDRTKGKNSLAKPKVKIPGFKENKLPNCYSL